MSLTYLYNKLEHMNKWEQFAYIKNILTRFSIDEIFPLSEAITGKNPFGYLLIHCSINQIQDLIPKYYRDLIGKSTFNDKDIKIMSQVDFALSLVTKRTSVNLHYTDISELLKVFQFGSTKYPDWDFLKVNPFLLVMAVARHAYKKEYISINDEESNLLHQAHIESNYRMITLINERNK